MWRRTSGGHCTSVIDKANLFFSYRRRERKLFPESISTTYYRSYLISIRLQMPIEHRYANLVPFGKYVHSLLVHAEGLLDHKRSHIARIL